ncbi:MAG: hypothetical protein LBQ59_03565 [Candidatus Peribacteria bacterium]|jgi:hypothetical protein|nr:hypothetical protein [Candidatus Peribacteria bacterium]
MSYSIQFELSTILYLVIIVQSSFENSIFQNFGTTNSVPLSGKIHFQIKALVLTVSICEITEFSNTSKFCLSDIALKLKFDTHNANIIIMAITVNNSTTVNQIFLFFI